MKHWLYFSVPHPNRAITVITYSTAVYHKGWGELILTDTYHNGLLCISQDEKINEREVASESCGICFVPSFPDCIYYSTRYGNIWHHELLSGKGLLIAQIGHPCKALVAANTTIYVTVLDAILQISTLNKSSLVWAGDFRSTARAPQFSVMFRQSRPTSGFVDGHGNEARFNDPYGMCFYPRVDGSSLLVADPKNNVVRVVDSAQDCLVTLLKDEAPFCTFPPGIVPMIATYFSSQGIVRTHPAKFCHPYDVASDMSGRTWVVDDTGLHQLTSTGAKLCYEMPRKEHQFRRLALAQDEWLFIIQYCDDSVYRVAWKDLLQMSN